MSVKDQLRERIEALSDSEAAEALRFLDQRADPLTVLLDNAPVEDELITAEEEAAVQEARDEIARGETVSLEELRAKYR
ncbi:MAG: hypothetical protein ACRDKL_05665 [Solirubrobacteraceae bacterium]